MINKFQKLSGWMKLSSVLIALIFPAIILVPLPGIIIDMFILFSFIASAMIFSIMLDNDNPLRVTFLPTMVLLLTTFRLLLSIATTRNILTNDNVGVVIETVGGFVTSAGLLSGIIVFIIITIVQFLVVTKGGERVAEVGARFSLDALPGRQMTIDGDLKNNMISPEEAQILRAELSTENRLFGALEGAMKFIKGDAIAGILISLVNLFGGIYVGINIFELSLIDSLHRFSMLTIGDGLVSQIPSLLLSIACGIYLTRIKGVNEKSTSFTGQLVRQVSVFWKNLIFIGGFILLLGFFSPSIFSICLSMALVCFILSFILWKGVKEQETDTIKIVDGEGYGLLESLTFIFKDKNHQQLVSKSIHKIENQLWGQNIGSPSVRHDPNLNNDIEVSVLGISLYTFKKNNDSEIKVEEILYDEIFFIEEDNNINLTIIIHYFLRKRLLEKYNIQITNNILDDLSVKSHVMRKEIDSAVGVNRVHDVIKQMISCSEFYLDAVSFFEGLIYWSRVEHELKNWFLRIRGLARYEITSLLMDNNESIIAIILDNDLNELINNFISGEENDIDTLFSIKNKIKGYIYNLVENERRKPILIVDDIDFNTVKSFIGKIIPSLIVCSYNDITDSKLITSSTVVSMKGDGNGNDGE